MKRLIATAILAVALVAIAQQSAQAGGITAVADQGPTYVQATHPGGY